MNEILRGLREYVSSGEYFTEARKWYNIKYLHPLSYRSVALCAATLFALLALVITMNLNSLFPLVRMLQYSITVSSKNDQTANVIKADQVANNPLRSIMEIMLRDYVKRREEYDYNSLASQMEYVKNTSTRLVYKRFYNYLSIDNPESPVMRYQKDAKRVIDVKSVEFIDDSSAEVTFTSEARDVSNQLFEDMTWVAGINFDSDKIKLRAPDNTPFNFVVMEYKLKIVGDKNAKN